MKRVSFLVGLMTAAALLGLGCGVAMAEDGHVAYVPITFDSEGGPIRTTACLQVTEQVYPPSAWWEDVGGKVGASKSAFMEVIAAIKSKDRAALLKLSDPTNGRDSKDFDQQASAFFQQFDVIKLLAVPRAYAFDGLVVFFAKFQSKTQTAFVPFAFAHEDDGSFGFLPYRSEQWTYQLVTNWFIPRKLPIPQLPATENPPFCTNADIKRATHRVSLVSPSSTPKQAWQPSELLLTGASIDAPGALATLAAKVTSTIGEMKSAVVDQRLDDFIKHLAPEGGKKMKEWFVSADPAERSRYFSTALTEQQPFFFFDASPLVVVYTRSPRGIVQVMYFTFNANNELVWTNSSYMTSSDKIFKQGPLYDAALLEKPFSSIVVTPPDGV